MSLWQEYQMNRETEVLIDGVTDSMDPALYSWLYEVAKHRLNDPYKVAVELKNRFRISDNIPIKRPNNYLRAEPSYSFARFLLNIAYSDSRQFFTMLDYLIQTYLPRDTYPAKLKAILDEAGHKYTLHKVDGVMVITEKLPEDQKELMTHLLENSQIYASEFRDAFVEIYGPNPNPTRGVGEAFQSLEAALKFYLGDDKGKNLGEILSWLRANPKKWKYNTPSDGQEDSEEQFTSLINFVNKAGRKVKHGQANVKLVVKKEHAESILRAVSFLIFQLENTIVLIEEKK